MNRRLAIGRCVPALILALAVFTACDDDLNVDFPRPEEPLETSLFDLVAGPIDRPSALNVVAARGRGFPVARRVDQTDQWDVAFAMLDGEPVWLPRGFFESLELSAGIVKLDRAFDEIERVPGDRQMYERENPVPLEVGDVFAIRSRSDPSLSLPCHIFAKLVVDAIEGDPARVRFRSLWNPNCDQTRVTPEGG